MKKLALLIFVLSLAFAFTAVASELAEVAKKERARREAVQKGGKMARVFTNQDVANLKATLAFEVSQPPEGETVEPEITTLPAVDRSLGETTAPPPEQVQGDDETEQLKQEREALEQQAKDAQQALNQGGGYHTRNPGNQYKIKREAETRIREIDQELEEKGKVDEQ